MTDEDIYVYYACIAVGICGLFYLYYERLMPRIDEWMVWYFPSNRVLEMKRAMEGISK